MDPQARPNKFDRGARPVPPTAPGDYTHTMSELAAVTPSRSLLPTASWLRPGRIGAVVLLLIAVPCFVTLPWSLGRHDVQRVDQGMARLAPSASHPLGTDELGRSMLWRSLLGGAVSLTVGISAAVIAVLIGVSIGAISGYAGGRIDALCMRFVDVVYGLPYILLVVLISLALQPLVVLALRSVVKTDAADGLASIVSILIAVGGVSWLTMARVIRGQVLSLRKQPFVEAARACGLGPMRILLRHITPNLVSPIIVYATLAVPAAILQESLLSFLGIGINPSVPSWGNMASAGLGELDKLTITGGRMDWWLLLWPCLLLGLTLLSLNFLGDALRNRFDPQIAR